MLLPKDLANYTCNVGFDKITKNYLKTIISGIIAGIFIGFGYYGFIVLSWFETLGFLSKFVGAIMFPIGFIIIVIGGGDLFTSNCLVSLGCINKQYKVIYVLKNLLYVLLGNLIGSLFLVLLFFLANIDSNYIKDYIIYIANLKIELTFIEAFFRGVLGNILVSTAIYLSYASKMVIGKIFAVSFPIMLFSVCNLEHSIANMFLLPYSIILGAEFSIAQMIFANLIPVLIGNIIGGAIIVPGLYYLVYLKNYKIDAMKYSKK